MSCQLWCLSFSSLSIFRSSVEKKKRDLFFFQVRPLLVDRIAIGLIEWARYSPSWIISSDSLVFFLLSLFARFDHRVAHFSNIIYLLSWWWIETSIKSIVEKNHASIKMCCRWWWVRFCSLFEIVAFDFGFIFLLLELVRWAKLVYWYRIRPIHFLVNTFPQCLIIIQLMSWSMENPSISACGIR